MSLKEFRAKCEANFPNNQHKQQIHSQQKFPVSNVNNYFFEHVPVGETMKFGLWSEEETQLLIDTINLGLKSQSDYIKPDGKVK